MQQWKATNTECGDENTTADNTDSTKVVAKDPRAFCAVIVICVHTVACGLCSAEL